MFVVERDFGEEEYLLKVEGVAEESKEYLEFIECREIVVSVSLVLVRVGEVDQFLENLAEFGSIEARTLE